MRAHVISRIVLVGLLASAGLWQSFAAAQTSVTTIVNPGFEIGTPGTAVNTGWTRYSWLGPMFITTGTGLSPGTILERTSRSI
jgi:hypothetical protein